jgi:hypothetical protein
MQAAARDESDESEMEERLRSRLVSMILPLLENTMETIDAFEPYFYVNESL